MDDPFLHRRRFLEAYEQLVASLGGWQQVGIPKSTWYSLLKLEHVPHATTLDALLEQRAQTEQALAEDAKARLYRLRQAAQYERQMSAQHSVPELPRQVEESILAAHNIITQIEFLNYQTAHGDPDKAHIYTARRNRLIARHFSEIAAGGLWDDLIFWGEHLLASTDVRKFFPDIFRHLIDAYARRGQWTDAEHLFSTIAQVASGGSSDTFTGIAYTIRAEYELIRSLHGFPTAFYEVEQSLNEALTLLQDQRPYLFAALLALGRVRQRYTERGAIEAFAAVLNDPQIDHHAEWRSLAEGNLSVVQYQQRHFRKAEIGLQQAQKGIRHLRDLTETYTLQASVHFQRGKTDRYLMWRIRGEQLAAEMRLVYPLSSTHAELIRLSGQERVIARHGCRRA